MMEAMAMGLPTISTNFSGVLDFMNEENSYLIKVEEMVTPKDKTLYKYEDMLWANPSVQHLKEIMRSVFEKRGEARKKGLIAREQIVKNYNESRISGLIVERLKQISMDLLNVK